MNAAVVGAVVGLIVAFLAVRTQEGNMRRDGYGNTSMAEREAINRARILGATNRSLSGAREYGCAFILLPVVGLILGAIIGALFG